ncbi:MAG: peptidoglycan-associated lipoprotein Pal [Thermoanaerobaculia bacterium]
MNTRQTVWTAALALSMVMTACAKKAPKTSDVNANPVPTPAPATDVNSRPKPTTSDTTEVNPLNDPDLARLNDYLVKQGLLGDVFFEYDKAELRDDARERLSKNADWLRSHPEFEVTIEGHCDERGTNEYNLALGARRSGSARDYITSLGVANSRSRSISYGEERPQCTASSESCWGMNRRAHFVVTGRTNVG